MWAPVFPVCLGNCTLSPPSFQLPLKVEKLVFPVFCGAPLTLLLIHSPIRMPFRREQNSLASHLNSLFSGFFFTEQGPVGHSVRSSMKRTVRSLVLRAGVARPVEPPSLPAIHKQRLPRLIPTFIKANALEGHSYPFIKLSGKRVLTIPFSHPLLPSLQEILTFYPSNPFLRMNRI